MFKALFVVSAVVGIGATGLIIYVAFHFLAKVW